MINNTKIIYDKKELTELRFIAEQIVKKVQHDIPYSANKQGGHNTIKNILAYTVQLHYSDQQLFNLSREVLLWGLNPSDTNISISQKIYVNSLKRISTLKEIEKLLFSGGTQALYGRTILEVYSNIITTAMLAGVGNCDELSTAVTVLLLEAKNKLQNKFPVEHVFYKTNENTLKYFDHALVLVGRDPSTDLQSPLSWNDDTLIVDAWTGTVYTKAEMLATLDADELKQVLDALKTLHHKLIHDDNTIADKLYVGSALEIPGNRPNYDILRPNCIPFLMPAQRRIEKFREVLSDDITDRKKLLKTAQMANTKVQFSPSECLLSAIADLISSDSQLTDDNINFLKKYQEKYQESLAREHSIRTLVSSVFKSPEQAKVAIRLLPYLKSHSVFCDRDINKANMLIHLAANRSDQLIAVQENDSYCFVSLAMIYILQATPGHMKNVLSAVIALASIKAGKQDDYIRAIQNYSIPVLKTIQHFSGSLPPSFYKDISAISQALKTVITNKQGHEKIHSTLFKVNIAQPPQPLNEPATERTRAMAPISYGL